MDGHLGCSHVFPILNSAAVSIRVHVSFPIIVFCGFRPRSGINRSYGSSIFSFLRNFHTVLWASLVAQLIKTSACNAGDPGSIPELGRSPGGGHGIAFQYSCLGNPHGQRRLAGYSPQGHKELDMTEQLSIAWSEVKWKSLNRVLLFSAPMDYIILGILQGSNPDVPHCRWILYKLSQKPYCSPQWENTMC